MVYSTTLVWTLWKKVGGVGAENEGVENAKVERSVQYGPAGLEKGVKIFSYKVGDFKTN